MQDDNILSFEPRRTGPDPKDKQPLINLPPFTKIFVMALLVIHLGISLMPEPTQYWIMEHFGFIPAYYTGAIPFDWPAVTGPFTFTFIHGGWMHVLMNGIMLIAFGAGLEPWMGWRRMVLLMLACNLVSVITQVIFSIGSTDPVIGASGALSGLFAAAIIMMQDRNGGVSTMGKYGYWPLILVWIGTSILFGVTGGPEGEAIAWPAHIGGFLTGFALYKPIMKIGRRL